MKCDAITWKSLKWWQLSAKRKKNMQRKIKLWKNELFLKNVRFAHETEYIIEMLRRCVYKNGHNSANHSTKSEQKNTFFLVFFVSSDINKWKMLHLSTLSISWLIHFFFMSAFVLSLSFFVYIRTMCVALLLFGLIFLQ